MAFYENVFIVRQDVSAQQVEDLTTRFAGIVSEGGGSVAKTEYWGLRSLAYKIKKNRKGHYVLLNLDAPSDAVKEMERNMNLNEDVMRFLTIRVDELEEGPSVMMRSRAAREDRDRDRGRPRAGGRDRDRDARPVSRVSDGPDAKAPRKPETSADGGKGKAETSADGGKGKAETSADGGKGGAETSADGGKGEAETSGDGGKK